MQGSLEVIKAGTLTLVQDCERNGAKRYGVGESGPVDFESAFWANRLVGNPNILPHLELLLGGLVLKVEGTTTVAFTGGTAEFRINGIEKNMWQSYQVQTGDEIFIGNIRSGLRGYLSIRGGIIAPNVLGSSATNTRELLGGTSGNGSSLQKSDKIPFHCSKHAQSLKLGSVHAPTFSDNVSLGLVMCCSFSELSKAMKRQLFDSEFTIGNEISRMGYRLTGPKLKVKTQNGLSEATCLGAIQLPPGGQPIVLLQDRQPVGGYPKIGAISKVDCWKLAQLRPGDTIRFFPLRPTSAQDNYRRKMIHLKTTNLAEA